MKENEAYDFSESILQYLKKELGPEEEHSFLEAIANDPEKKKIFECYQDSNHLDQDLEYYKQIDTDEAWNKIMSKKAERVEKAAPSLGYFTLKKYLPYAAILVCVLGFGLWKFANQDDKVIADNQFGYNNDVLAGSNSAVLRLSDGKEIELGQSAEKIKDGTTDVSFSKNRELKYNPSLHSETGQFNEINVSSAGKFKISLSDGTEVWVSSSSKLRYPVAFEGNERRVSLEGEAYFHVAKDAKKPFYVEVGGKTIRVLGTQFNVSAYTKNVRTTLVEGSVRIEDGKSISLLKPGEQAVFKPQGVTISTANVEKDIAWKEGYFTFEHDRIQDIMEEIARWYEVKVIYEGNLKDEVYSGSVPRASSLGGILRALTDVSGLQFEIDGRKVTVKIN